jgi:uncharacterized protein (TIGR03437 family)
VFAYDTSPPTQSQIFIVSSTDEGQSFSNAVRVVVTSAASRRPAVAVGSKSGALHIAWTDLDPEHSVFSVVYCKSSDGPLGRAFTAPVVVSADRYPLDPRATLDDQENLYLTWTTGTQSIYERQVVFSRSTDGGRSFAASRPISDLGPYTTPNILWFNGQIHLVWRNIDSGTVYYARSTDNGDHFSAALAVPGTLGSAAPQDELLSLVGLSGGALGVLYRNASGPTPSINFVPLQSGTGTPGTPVPLSGVLAPGSLSALVRTGDGTAHGNAAAAWIGLQSSVQTNLPGVFVSCTPDPLHFDDTRMVVSVDPSARELAAAPAPAGPLHLAFAQPQDTGARLMYAQVRCPPTFTSMSTVNAATQVSGGIAPGSLISIYGADLGPTAGVGPLVEDTTGLISTQRGGAEVRVNEVAAPLLFVRSDQVNLQVPFEIAGSASAKFSISNAGVVSKIVEVPVQATSPGFFTADGSGTGLVAAVNEDGTINSGTNPALRGSIVTLFLTGQGVVAPPIRTGELGPSNDFPLPAQSVSANIGSRAATVLFAGIAPQFLGLLQVNARVASDAATGLVPVSVQIGESASPPGTLLSVR